MEIVRSSPTVEVKELLVANELPIDDLDDPTVELFTSREGERLLGAVGLQWLDGAALLRSLAVHPTARERGLGARLCERATREAVARRQSELWLLTTSARVYFERRGFEVVAREWVPAAVRATAQFSSLCPSSASVMRLRIG